VRLRALAPAKVNLALMLGAVRADGRHRLVTVFQSLSLADELELELAEGQAGDSVSCPGVQGENLVARALAELREAGWGAPPVHVRVHKRIPVAGGMAGGSADAAAALRLAVALDRELRPAGTPLHTQAGGALVARVAAALGADVPSQLEPGLALGTGAGEVVRRLSPLREHAFLVLPAPHALPTPEVFREADRLRLGRDGGALDALELELPRAFAPGSQPPRALVTNDLEPAAVSLCPWCGTALEELAALGAEQAMVSGSGPTVFGLWWGAGARNRAAEARALLAERHPRAVVCEPVDARFAAAALT